MYLNVTFTCEKNHVKHMIFDNKQEIVSYV